MPLGYNGRSIRVHRGNEQVDFVAGKFWSARQLNQSPLGDDDVRKEIIFPKSGTADWICRGRAQKAEVINGARQIEGARFE